jgi:hypothetical protein
MKDHRLIDERSLAFCRLIARKWTRIRRSWTQRALTCNAGWPHARPALLEWQAALEQPSHATMALLLGTNERSVRLRQSNPFAGVLTPAERNAILCEFQARESAAA